MLMAVGLGAYARVNSVTSLMICSFVWSVGMHLWMPIQSSLAMHLADANNKGKRLGQTACAGSFGSVLGMAAVMLISHKLLYQSWFLIGGILVAIAGFIMLMLRRDIGHAEKPRFVWKRKYSLYYALTLLEGCRKQVFFTFAPYALTKVYHTPLRIIAS
jgi:4-hydroxybenzoate polyprenyltransferase